MIIVSFGILFFLCYHIEKWIFDYFIANIYLTKPFIGHNDRYEAYAMMY